tara:strand:+ start:518 stop:1123 length:606 start_codon:yes stop_codon:yes gene_type:complete
MAGISASLRDVILSNMDVTGIPVAVEEDDVVMVGRDWSTVWKLFNKHSDLREIMPTVENNFDNLSWITPEDSKQSFRSGWYLWDRPAGYAEGHIEKWLIWLSPLNFPPSQQCTNSGKTGINLEDMAFMNVSIKGFTGHDDINPDSMMVEKVFSDGTWTHGKGDRYALILPTDGNKRWVTQKQVDSATLNWKHFPNVLLEGA